MTLSSTKICLLTAPDGPLAKDGKTLSIKDLVEKLWGRSRTDRQMFAAVIFRWRRLGVARYRRGDRLDELASAVAKALKLHVEPTELAQAIADDTISLEAFCELISMEKIEANRVLAQQDFTQHGFAPSFAAQSRGGDTSMLEAVHGVYSCEFKQGGNAVSAVLVAYKLLVDAERERAVVYSRLFTRSPISRSGWEGHDGYLCLNGSHVYFSYEIRRGSHMKSMLYIVAEFNKLPIQIMQGYCLSSHFAGNPNISTHNVSLKRLHLIVTDATISEAQQAVQHTPSQ